MAALVGNIHLRALGKTGNMAYGICVLLWDGFGGGVDRQSDGHKGRVTRWEGVNADFEYSASGFSGCLGFLFTSYLVGSIIFP